MTPGWRLAAALTAALFVSAGTAEASLRLEIVHENPAFELKAVDHAGVAYGLSRASGDSARGYRLYRSADEGRNWTRLFDFPSTMTLKTISVLSNDTLIAALGGRLYRSANGGVSWTRVFTMPTGYRTLSPHSVTDNGRAVFVGSYTASSGTRTNWVWRSTDDGRTWQVIRKTTTHRHVHFVQANPYTGDIYVGYGDTAAQSEIERSKDDGQTWQSVCKGDVCRVVSMAFDPAGYAIFGMDQPSKPAYIMRLDLESRALTRIARLPGASYSAMRLRDGVWLIGEAHEPGSTDTTDTDVHLFGSDDGGATFADVFHRPYLDPKAYVRMDVYFAFPNGDFSIEIGGYGTVVARAVSEEPLPSLRVSPTSLTFSAPEGETPTEGSVETSTSDDSVTEYSVSEDAAWLTVTPVDPDTPGQLTGAVDLTGLAPGTYKTSVTVSADGYTSASLPVTLIVPGPAPPPALLYSTAADRAAPQPLVGATVSGVIYAFESIEPAGVARVDFYLDKPAATGTPWRSEQTAPYDFNGGTATIAKPFDTQTLANGSHTITALVVKTDGTRSTESATFSVANGP